MATLKRLQLKNSPRPLRSAIFLNQYNPQTITRWVWEMAVKLTAWKRTISRRTTKTKRLFTRMSCPNSFTAQWFRFQTSLSTHRSILRYAWINPTSAAKTRPSATVTFTAAISTLLIQTSSAFSNTLATLESPTTPKMIRASRLILSFLKSSRAGLSINRQWGTEWRAGRQTSMTATHSSWKVFAN